MWRRLSNISTQVPVPSHPIPGRLDRQSNNHRYGKAGTREGGSQGERERGREEGGRLRKSDMGAGGKLVDDEQRIRR